MIRGIHDRHCRYVMILDYDDFKELGWELGRVLASAEIRAKMSCLRTARWLPREVALSGSM